MPKFSAEYLSRHLILAALTITLFAVFTVMIMLLLMEKSEGVFPWILLAAGFITLYFTRRLQPKLFTPPVVQEYSGKMAYLNGIGGLRGMLFMGVAVLLGKVVLLFIAPSVLRYPVVPKVLSALAVCSFAVGCCFPVVRAGKRERAWLATGIIAQTFLFLALDIVTLPVQPPASPAPAEIQAVKAAK